MSNHWHGYIPVPPPISANSDFHQSARPRQLNAAAPFPQWPLPNHLTPQADSMYIPRCGSYLPPPIFRMGGTYSPNVNAAFNSDQREKWADTMYLENFIRHCEQNQICHHTSPGEKDTFMKLSDVKEMHGEAYAILKSLESLNACGSKTDKETRELRLRLSDILSILNDEKGASLRAQGERRVRRRGHFYRRRKKLDEAVHREGREVNIWLQERQHVDKEVKRDDQVRKEVEDHMHKNSRFKTNLHKYLELLSALAKLRRYRSSSGTRESLDINNEMFLKVHKLTKNYLMTTIASTEEEQCKLQIYIGNGQDRKAETTKRNVGKETGEVSHSGSEPDQHASGNFLASVNIRLQWDQFLSDSGSFIPNFFVLPPVSPRQVWSTYRDMNAVYEE